MQTAMQDGRNDTLEEGSLGGKKEAKKDQPQVAFPEGGISAWSVVAGAFCISFCTFGYLNAYGVYQNYYSTHQLMDKSASTISWIGSVQTCLLLGGGIVGGPLFDRYGAMVIWPAAVAFIFSVMMTSLCKEYYQFMLAQGILGGLADGIMFSPAMAAVSHYFQARRGAALGVTVTGSSLGGVIFPIAMSRMFANESLGFGWTVRIIGFIMLALLSISLATVRPRLPPRKGKILVPSAFKHVGYSLFLGAMFLMIWGVFTPFFYLTEYAIAHGMSTNLASYILSILNAASVFGRLLPGVIADKAGRFNTICLFGLSTGILLLCWIAVKSNAAILVFAALYGFFSGAIVSLMSPCIAHLSPTPGHIGTYLGMGMAVISLAGLTGTPITGALIDHYKSFTQAAIFSGVSTLVGALLVFVTKLTMDKNPCARI
ncbi:putative monocarboxylate transporter [Aspergillus cavernicola]|uniref:Monocarboxylate transporter n=1 Tax=Aspergillus cavernicola TaxID=176166 RepID=A0ABR4IHW2_9EURO